MQTVSSIHLLGRPWLACDGDLPHAPRGRKAWGLLAYLVMATQPHSRDHLASLLFAEADDPFGALRWNLAELRRSLRLAQLLRGERISLSLPEGTYVDVQVVTSGSWMDAAAVPGLGCELLAGMDFPTSPGFEAWLLNERRRLAVVSLAALREGAMARLAAGDAVGAQSLAARMVTLAPYEEDGHALLIRAYVAGGDEDAASRQWQACTETLRRELSAEPGPAVAAALRSGAHRAGSGTTGAAASGRAQLDAGLAALKAGVLDAGLECLARAAADAARADDPELQARATFELGSALVHSGRSRYEEGATVLHEVLPAADTLGDTRLRAAAARELAWVELLTARYDRAEVWLQQALDETAGEPRETAAALWVLGMALTEVARYQESMAALRKAITLADSVDDARTGGIARALLGKAHLMRGELDDARPALEQSLDIFTSAGWTWLLPWAEAYLGELELFVGDLDRAERLLDHAFSLSAQISDPCFCTKSEANLGLLEAMRGDLAAAESRLASARMWLIRTPDHMWSLGYALDASCIVGTSFGLSDTGRWIDELEHLAGRSGMRELVARSYVHRHNATGEPSALETARLLAADIDNPRLHLIVEEPERVLL